MAGADLVTKDYLDLSLRDLERRLEARIMESRFDLLRWVVGLALAQAGLLIGILVKLL